jgi:hypothetical protein
VKRIPSKFRFPGGFTLYIDQVNHGEERRGVTLPDDCDAYFDTIDVGSGQVLIDVKKTPRQKWRLLAHEMVHAALDAGIQIEHEVAP